MNKTVITYESESLSETTISADQATTKRLPVIDMMRGIAMLLMLLDHTAYFAHFGILAESYNGVRPMLESPPHFLTGMLTNIATPVFMLLTGSSVAFVEASRLKKNHPLWRISRFLVCRALLLFGLDFLIERTIYNAPPALSVLSAAGLALLMLTGAQFLRTNWIIVIASAILLIYPTLWQMYHYSPTSPPPPLVKILFYSEQDAPPLVQYPALGWPILALFGYVFGRLIQHGQINLSSKRIFKWAAVSMMVFFGLRILGGYGNFLPYSPNQPLIYFFIENKQPPSLTYILWNSSLALGIFGLILHFEHQLQRSIVGRILIVFGQIPLFFYVTHLLVLKWGNDILPFQSSINKGLIRNYLEFIFFTLLLYPISAFYRHLRLKNPDSLLRYF